MIPTIKKIVKDMQDKIAIILYEKLYNKLQIGEKMLLYTILIMFIVWGFNLIIAII